MACRRSPTRGNVLRPQTALKLSLRLPPTVDGATAERAMQAPARSRSAVRRDGALRPANRARPDGTRRRPTPWLARAIDEASSHFYGKPSAAMGEGGTIPFMAMLGKHFPDAQFLITGVLGPQSNAHGPNEFLHVPYASKLTACVAYVLAAHAAALVDPRWTPGPAFPTRRGKTPTRRCCCGRRSSARSAWCRRRGSITRGTSSTTSPHAACRLRRSGTASASSRSISTSSTTSWSSRPAKASAEPCGSSRARWRTSTRR